MWRLTLCLLCITALSEAVTRITFGNHSDKFSSVGKRVKMFNIVPDLLSVSPYRMIHASYQNDEKMMFLGRENLTAYETENAPYVIWFGVDAKIYYTLIMVCLDVPTRADPKDKEWVHWLVANIPGNIIEMGDVLYKYMGSGPHLKPDSGIHRNVILIYQQPSIMKFKKPTIREGFKDNRLNFSVNKFAAKYNLSDPIAINFYEAKYDKYVPFLLKQYHTESILGT